MISSHSQSQTWVQANHYCQKDCRLSQGKTEVHSPGSSGFLRSCQTLFQTAAWNLISKPDGTSGVLVQESQDSKLLGCVGFENATLQGSCILLFRHRCGTCVCISISVTFILLCVCPWDCSHSLSRGRIHSVCAGFIVCCAFQSPQACSTLALARF